VTEWASPGLERLIARKHAEGERVSALARDHGYTRSGIYALLERSRYRERRERRRARLMPQPIDLSAEPERNSRRQNALSRWLSL